MVDVVMFSRCHVPLIVTPQICVMGSSLGIGLFFTLALDTNGHIDNGTQAQFGALLSLGCYTQVGLFW